MIFSSEKTSYVVTLEHNDIWNTWDDSCASQYEGENIIEYTNNGKCHVFTF